MTADNPRNNGYHGHGEKYSRKREEAITALMTCSTVEGAAEQVDVDKSTLYRWLDRKDFQREYKQARRKALNQAIARLQEASTEAVDTLREVMNDPEVRPATRVQAAQKMLKLAIEAAEIEDLQDRLSELEDVLLSRGDR